MPNAVPQRVGAYTRIVFYPETAYGADPGSPLGYVLPLAGESGFEITQPLVGVPVFKADRLPDENTYGDISAQGPIALNLDFMTLSRIFKELVGASGYSRPGGGSTSLHRFIAPSDFTGPGSCQIQSEQKQATAQFDRARGCRIGAIALRSGAEAAGATVDVNFMGNGDVVGTDLAGTVADEANNATSYFNGRIRLDDTLLVGLTNLTLNIDPMLSRQPAAFNDGIAAAINYGKFKISGSLGLIFGLDGSNPENNKTFYNKAVNQADVKLECIWTDLPVGTQTMWHRFRTSQARFGRRSFKPGADGGLMITQDFDVRRGGNKFAAEAIGTTKDTFNIGASTFNVGVKIDGGGTLTIALTQGAARTADQVVADLNADGPFSAVALAVNFLDQILIRSKGTGGSSTSVQLDAAQVNNAHTVLGFDGTSRSGLSGVAWVLETYNSITSNL
jgi:hypothetical protein